MLSLKLAQVFCAQYTHNFFNDHIIIKTSIIEVFLKVWQNFSMTWYALLDIPGWQIKKPFNLWFQCNNFVWTKYLNSEKHKRW